MNEAVGSAEEVSAAGGSAMQDLAEPFQVNGSLLRIACFANADQARHAFLTGETSQMRAANDPIAKPYGLFLQTNTIGEPSYIGSLEEPGFV